MDYDRVNVIGSSVIISNIRIDSNILIYNQETTEMEIYFDFLLNLPEPVVYNLDPSFIKIICEDNIGNVIQNTQTPFMGASSLDGYLQTKVPITIPSTTNTIKLQGRIYLSNNTYFVINKTLTEGVQFIPTFFTLSN